MKLTQKQENFRNDVYSGMTQRDAYIKHYNTENMLSDTIDKAAYQLMNNPKIASSLQDMRLVAKGDAIASVQERQEILTEIVRGKLVDFIDKSGNITLNAPNNGALQEVTVLELKGSSNESIIAETKKIKLHNPITAIAELNKMDGAYEPVKIDVTAGLEALLGRLQGRKELPEGEE